MNNDNTSNEQNKEKVNFIMENSKESKLWMAKRMLKLKALEEMTNPKYYQKEEMNTKDDSFNAIEEESIDNKIVLSKEQKLWRAKEMLKLKALVEMTEPNPKEMNEEKKNETANTTTLTSTKTPKKEIMKNIKWIVLVILALLILLNPSPSTFRIYIEGKTGDSKMRTYRMSNYFIFSIYYNGGNKRNTADELYVGFLENFIEIE